MFKPFIPPISFPARAPGEPKPAPRTNEPVAVIKYEQLEDLFTQAEPTIRNVVIGKQGEINMAFSKPISYPKEWLDFFEES